MRQKIGVGITTRNRVHVLDLMLKHHVAFFPIGYDVHYFVIDDCSDDDYSQLMSQHSYCFYYKSQARLGIAKAKNECIKHLRGCDYIFLFDDDACPRQMGWENCYIHATIKSGAEHLQHQIQIAGLSAQHTKNGVTTFDNGGGVLLYFTKAMLEKVGGFDPNFGIYGHEHANLSSRCLQASGGNQYGRYVSPTNTGEFIYSLDFDLNHLGVHAPLGSLEAPGFTSSLRGEESSIQAWINANASIGGTPLKVQI